MALIHPLSGPRAKDASSTHNFDAELSHIDISSIRANFRDSARRAGYKAASLGLAYAAARRFVDFHCADIICLEREHYTPSRDNRYNRFEGYASILATRDQVHRMRSDPRWQVSDELVAAFERGDHCLISQIDGAWAGYTWVHDAGRARLRPGLELQIPRDFAYNYAGFTLPEFRGRGLQSYRHHQLLQHPKWLERRGFLGYVAIDNWSSKRGQHKSGYTAIGHLLQIGSGPRSKALVTPGLRELGIYAVITKY